MAILEDVKKKCELYSLLASLFYSTGDFKHCEKCYV